MKRTSFVLCAVLLASKRAGHAPFLTSESGKILSRHLLFDFALRSLKEDETGGGYPEIVIVYDGPSF